ncbi:Uncharacterized protein HZ326_1360 [Fusarium oxysporum f. sp. albedinis]|nr:Uncharacterized protein HZ326_1360 [Fusarium oxysporum f. sp. albedinis]
MHGNKMGQPPLLSRIPRDVRKKSGFANLHIKSRYLHFLPRSLRRFISPPTNLSLDRISPEPRPFLTWDGLWRGFCSPHEK